MTPYIRNIQPRVSLAYYLSLFFLYMMAISAIFPPIRALPFFNSLWPLFMLSWLLATILASRDFLLKPSFHKIAVFFLILYAVLIAYLSGVGFIGNRYLELMQIIIFYWGFELCKKKNRIIDAIRLIYGCIPFVVAVSLITISKYSQYPNISRTAKKDTEEGLQQMLQGVGGYDFIYFLLFLLLPLMYLVFDSRFNIGTLRRGALILVLSLFMINIVSSNFSTALLLLFLAVIFKVAIKRSSKVSFLIYAFFSIALIPFASLIISLVIDLTVDYLGATLNASRLIEVKGLLLFGATDTSIGARFDAFMLSIDAFLKNPVFGIVISGSTSSSSDIVFFGQHSFFLDGFALFGVFFGLLQVYVFMYPLKAELKLFSKHQLSFPFLLFVMSLLFFTINNAVPSVGFAIYFVFPVLNHFMANAIDAPIKYKSSFCEKAY